MKKTLKSELENMALARMTAAIRTMREKPEYIAADEEHQDAMQELAYYMQGLRDGISLVNELGVLVNE